MPEVSACIDMMFPELPFEARPEAAAACGLSAMEFWKWSNKNLPAVRRELDRLKLDFTVFNVDSRDEKLSYALSRGILNLGQKEVFVGAVRESIPAYHLLEARGMIVLLGEETDAIAPEVQLENAYAALASAAEVAEKANVTLVVEPLNNVDRLHYWMPHVTPVLALLKRVGSDHVKLLYDLYHQNVMGDFSMEEIRTNIGRIGHFHVADAPGRHEPGTGTVDYVSVLREIAALPYTGTVGLEYRATRPVGETLGFLKEAGYLV